MGVIALSDTGKVRAINEDSFLKPIPALPVAVVADGMGGHLAGEVASSIAIQVIEEEARAYGRDELTVKTAVAWVRKANDAIYAAAQKNDAQRGMGTTLTLLWLMPGRALVAHVGDSRAYLVRDGELRRLTQDHSLVEELLRAGMLTEEEAKVYPYRNVITRALGAEDSILVDAQEYERHEDDIYLLCSDGLTGYVEDTELCAILSATDQPLSERAQTLMNLALERGGRDNITLVVIEGEVA